MQLAAFRDVLKSNPKWDFIRIGSLIQRKRPKPVGGIHSEGSPSESADSSDARGFVLLTISI